MENINYENLKGAFNGFVSSVSQTGSNVGTHLGSSFASLGDTISNQLPAHWSTVLGVQPPPPPPPAPSFMQEKVDYVVDWFLKHPKLAPVLLLSGVSATFYALHSYQVTPFGSRSRRVSNRGHQTTSLATWFSKPAPPRLAQRASSGGRKEVVLLVGSPNEPLVRLIAQDLNIRGFIVYITATPNEEAVLGRELSENDDICALKLDSYFDATSVQSAVSQLQLVLDTKVRAFPGAELHNLVLRGIVVIPDLFYPAGPIELTSSSQWAQTLQSKVQMPLNFLSLGAIELARKHRSKFVFITPAIMGPLSPAFHSAESMVYGALSTLALSLARELEPQGISVTHLKLGSFDTRGVKLRATSPRSNHVVSANGRQSTPHPKSSASRDRAIAGVQADILSWPESMRHLYGSRYSTAASNTIDRKPGSNLHELYYSIYDIMNASSPQRVVRVGKGSWLYEWIVALVPEWMLTRLLAMRRD